jgi:hypothetical protein
MPEAERLAGAMAAEAVFRVRCTIPARPHRSTISGARRRSARRDR